MQAHLSCAEVMGGPIFLLCDSLSLSLKLVVARQGCKMLSLFIEKLGRDCQGCKLCQGYLKMLSYSTLSGDFVCVCIRM
jgi:hypothetical protein